jgi:hypothetical protein
MSTAARARAEAGMDGLHGQASPEGGSDVSQPLAEEPQTGVGVEAQNCYCRSQSSRKLF